MAPSHTYRCHSDNAPATFQRCMTAIFHELIEDNMEVFMDDFFVFGSSFDHCHKNLEKMLKRCEETNLVLNWEKCHFMVKEGIVLGHKVSGSGIEVDKTKFKVISKLPYPTNVKAIRSFLGHAGFYRRFIKDFSQVTRPMTQLLVKDAPFNFSKECTQAFNKLKHKLTHAPFMIKPDWSLPFKVMCGASDYAVGAVLGQRIDKHFKPIHYASKMMNEAQENYTTTKKELLAIVFTFDKFHQYLVLSKTIVFTDHSALRCLFTKQDTEPRLIGWILLLQEFNIEIRDKKGAENLTADHLSWLENPDLGKLTKAEIRDLFPEERLMAVSDKNNKLCSVLTEPYEDASPEMRQHKSFDSVTVAHQEGIMVSPLQREKSLKADSTGQISSVMHVDFMGPFPSSNGNKYILVAIDYVSKWVEAQAFPTNDARNINELEEMRLDAYESSISYKERTKRWHDKRIKTPTNYKKGDKVLLFNSRLRLFPGKLKSRWYGPFSISKDMRNGAIELYDEDGNEFIVNKQRVKPYKKDVLDTNKDDDITLDDEGEVTQRRVTSSLATRLINKEKRFLGGNPMKFFKENENKILSEAGDDVRIYPDGVVSPATGKFKFFQVIFDEKKLGSS
ncbi:reverse transcriptase domain-containing protein [Tanacetum coccineum]